jgi:tRNA-2-methylthio-N6-dimethylallyladenosine synthase
MIAGFPTETDQDHQDTMDLMDYVQYDFGFMFAYSERPGTLAARKIEDNVPEETKKKRLSQIIEKQQQHSRIRTEAFLGQTVCVLVEKESKRSQDHWSGRTTQNTVAVFPKKEFKVGDFVEVKINDCTSATLLGEAIELSNRV